MRSVNLAILAIALTFSLVGLLIFTFQRFAARRRAALETVAQQAGWSFSGVTISPETLVARPFPLFKHGRARKAYNVMSLRGGTATVLVFDYEYIAGTGEEQGIVRQTVVNVSSPGLSVPPFVLAPAKLLQKIGGQLGSHDIDFDSSSEFSKRYRLRGKESERRVRKLFTPAVRAYFEQRTPLTVESVDNQILVYKEGRRIKPGKLQTFVEEAQSIARALGA
jgi:hypothetical protein